MPGVGTPMVSSRVIGRSTELERIDAALDAAGRGEGGVLMVAGEAGIGKTRLIGELAARAERRGWRVCIGGCVDLGESSWPLAPLRDIVGDLLDGLDAEALELVLGDARSVLAGLVPELGTSVSDDAADRLPGTVLGVFQRLARRSPVVVVFEDLHWADGSTRALFAALTRVGRPGSMLVVGTFRDDELHRRHPLRATLAEVARGPPGANGSSCPHSIRTRRVEMVGVLTGDVDAELAASIHRRTGGNPYFLEELLAARSGGVVGLPATLRDAVLARAATFEEADGGVLAAVAAAGTTLPVVLGDTCGLPPAEMQRSLATLIGSGLLIADGDEVRFRHDLAREVFVDELLSGERERLHAALAASLRRTVRTASARSPCTGRRLTRAHGRWRPRSRPVARRCGPGPPGRRSTISGGPWNGGIASTTPTAGRQRPCRAVGRGVDRRAVRRRRRTGDRAARGVGVRAR